MKATFFSLLFSVFQFEATTQSLVDYVNPLIGTAPASTISALKHSEAGNEKNAQTIPAVTAPFAMTQWTAQTRSTELKCIAPYYFTDKLFSGYRGSHWLSGSCTQDYGSVTIMPITGILKTKAEEYGCTLNHQKEKSMAHYYSLQLDQYNLFTEITATSRASIQKYTALKEDSLHILITPNSDEKQGFVFIDTLKNMVWGYNPVHRIYQGWGEYAGFKGWFCIKANKKHISFGTFNSNQIHRRSISENNDKAGAYISFLMNKDESLTLKIGTSFTSLEGAIKNLESEIGNQDFEEIKTKSADIWNDILCSILIETPHSDDKKIFYTSLYHSFQHPRTFNDVDGSYPAFSKGMPIQKMITGDYFDDFSMWDIYRAQLPLIEIINPGLAESFVRSLIVKGEQGGWLPIFPCWNSYTAAMIGDHVSAYIASVYAKGLRNFDVAKAFNLMRKNAFESPTDYTEYRNGMGRRALTSYLKYGFIPMEDSVQEAFHKKEQVSRTLEYAYDDYALSTMASSLSKPDDFKLLTSRSYYYKNIFDPSVGMMRGKYSYGAWYKSFNADKREVYITEGTPRQYSLYVPHDVKGFSNLVGGEKKLESYLDSLFIKDEYWHGNEPGHQIPFMYNYTPSPWKTQKYVQKILKEEYTGDHGGLSGNDDAGQMSAWQVFASMGFYPMNPISGEYMLCTPKYEKIEIRNNTNTSCKISCIKSNENDIYIKSIKWNGKPYSKNYITYSMIRSGGHLEITSSSKPTDWGAKKSSRGFSLTK